MMIENDQTTKTDSSVAEKTQKTPMFDGVDDQVTVETRKYAAGIVGKVGEKDGWEKVVHHLDKDIKIVEQGASHAFNAHNGFGKIRVHLKWSQPEPETWQEKIKALMGKKPSVDLDIGCLYELKDGSRGVIQAFGESFGKFDDAPYISLAGDDKTGETAGEDLYINGLFWDRVRRIVLYAYIYKGAQCWSKTDARVTIAMPHQNPLRVCLSQYQDGLPIVAVAKLVNEDGAMQVSNLNEYFPGHPEMERAFGFGINWEQGQKS